MIQAKEFRIGNLMYDTTGKVNMVSIDALRYLLDYGETPMCQAKPIPLTDEILRDWCGFKNDYDKLYFYYDLPTLTIHINPISQGISLFDDYDEQIAACAIEIKYLHQLQNLYFSLTGQELIINIPKIK